MRSPLRFPGGKYKLSKEIIPNIDLNRDLEYREPFFGGGSIGLLVFKHFDRVWINDFDLGISSLWTTIIRRPDLLIDLVLGFKPYVEAFEDFKEELLSCPNLKSDVEVADFGFKKSYSGLGTKSGGPLGGKSQESKYKIDCRWSADYIVNKINILHEQFSKLSIRENCCTNLDFSKVISDEGDAVLFLDPPYYEKGADLYQHFFRHEDHVRLAEGLKGTKHKWVLTYDDCPEIHGLYEWANVKEISGVKYSITALKDKETGERTSRTKKELLISN